MSSANTKVYHCSTCQDNITYNRKQILKHIKTPEHTRAATINRSISKLESNMIAGLRNPKYSNIATRLRRFRTLNNEIDITIV